MQTRALSVLFSSVPITARTQTSALWSAFWWAPMRQTPLWISAPTASPSARSKRTNIVIANQPAGWCGNLLNRGTVRGIPTPVCALARNDIIIMRRHLPPYFPLDDTGIHDIIRKENTLIIVNCDIILLHILYMLKKKQ